MKQILLSFNQGTQSEVLNCQVLILQKSMLSFERLKKSNTLENLWPYILLLLKEKNFTLLRFSEKLRKNSLSSQEKSPFREFFIDLKNKALLKVK